MRIIMTKNISNSRNVIMTATDRALNGNTNRIRLSTKFTSGHNRYDSNMDTMKSGKMSRKFHRMNPITNKVMIETILLVRDPQRVDVMGGKYRTLTQTSLRDSIASQ